MCRQSLNMEKTGFCDRGSRYILHWCVDWEYQISVPRDYTLIMNLNLLKSICSSKCNWLPNPISDRNSFPLHLTLFWHRRSGFKYDKLSPDSWTIVHCGQMRNLFQGTDRLVTPHILPFYTALLNAFIASQISPCCI